MSSSPLKINKASAPHTTSVFISYVRENENFVFKLREALNNKGIVCYGDWDIPKAISYEPELRRLNTLANAFIFIISPDSIHSKECKKEIALAVENKKLIIPISYKDHGDDNLLDSAIRTPQWIFIRDDNALATGAEEVSHALKTDFNLLEIHTKLLVRSNEWIAQHKKRSYLLKSEQLNEAEEWLQQTARQVNKLPQPTSAQIEYVVTSQRNKARNTRISLLIAGCLITVFFLLSVYALSERQTAQKHLKSFKIEQFQRNLRNAEILKRGHEDSLAYREYLRADSIAKEYPNDSVIASKLNDLANNIKAYNTKIILQ